MSYSISLYGIKCTVIHRKTHNLNQFNDVILTYGPRITLIRCRMGRIEFLIRRSELNSLMNYVSVRVLGKVSEVLAAK